MVKKTLTNPNSEDFDLTILPVKQDNYSINIRRPIHPMLPKADKGSLLITTASVRSGKTNLLTNIFGNSNFYRDAFDAVYIFSSTIAQDQTGRRLKEMFPNTTYDTFDENKLQRILDYQLQQDDDEREAIAIMLDDLPNYLKPKSLFFTLASNYRHFGIGLLSYSVQSFKMIPPIVRNNATNLLLGTLNPSQLEQVSQEYSDHFGGKDNFKRMYRIAVPERFNFLYMRMDEHPAILHKNFDEKILYQDQE